MSNRASGSSLAFITMQLAYLLGMPVRVAVANCDWWHEIRWPRDDTREFVKVEIPHRLIMKPEYTVERYVRRCADSLRKIHTSHTLETASDHAQIGRPDK